MRPTSNRHSELEVIRSELELLQSKYQRLVKEKERLEAQYQADYRKWREFKNWVLSGSRKTNIPPRPSKMKDVSTDSKLSEPPVTATSTKPTNAPDAYAQYKGRGRYAQELEDGNDTINAQYRVNPARNAGVAYQFDEVVRSKHKRRHLDAEDCDCCHDYYEAVGAVPDPPQQPLWRSPPKTPVKRRRVHEDESHTITPSRNHQDDTVADHRKEISRHRQQWAVPKTPPRYWDISFPDTQEAADINKQADEIHQRKRRNIEDQARRGDKYVRRRST